MNHDPLQQREAQAQLDFVHTYLAMGPRQRKQMLHQLLIDILDIEEQSDFEKPLIEMIAIVESEWECVLESHEERVQKAYEHVFTEHEETLKKLAE